MFENAENFLDWHCTPPFPLSLSLAHGDIHHENMGLCMMILKLSMKTPQTLDLANSIIVDDCKGRTYDALGHTMWTCHFDIQESQSTVQWTFF